MAVRTIVTYPSPVLKERCAAVTAVADDLRGHALVEAGVRARNGQEGPVTVAVGVDEPRSHHEVRSIDDPGGLGM